MTADYFEDNVFEKQNLVEKALTPGVYEGCTFRQCLLEGANLSNLKFVDCVFDGCNLSLANLQQTVFNNVQFSHCKMLGLRFDDCNKFGCLFSFEDCTLNHSSFYQVVLKNTIFNNCQLKEADFTGADSSAVVFDMCDLERAVFESTNLEKADLRTAFNFVIDPEKNKLKKAKFSLHSLGGLLAKYQVEIYP